MNKLYFLLAVGLTAVAVYAGGDGDAESPVSGDKIDLEAQIFIGGYGNEVWNTALEAFKEAYPQYNLIVKSGPKVNHEMRTRWVSNDPPDFVNVDGDDGGLFQTLWGEKQLMDISSFMEERTISDGKTLAEKVVPGFLSSQQLAADGGVYLAPWFSYYWTFWYDERNFGGMGREIPDTIEEIIAYNETSETPFVAYAGVYPDYIANPFFLAAVAGEGGSDLATALFMADPDAVGNPATRRAVDKMVQLIDAGIFMDGTAALSHIESQMELLNGGALLVPSGTWIESEMKNDIPEGFTFRSISSLTRSDETQNFGATGGFTGFAIAQNAKNPEGAKDMISFFYEDDQIIHWVNSTGAPTPLIVADPGRLELSDGVKATLEWMSRKDVNVSAPVRYASASVEYTRTMSQGINALVLGEMTAEEFIESLYDAIGS